MKKVIKATEKMTAAKTGEKAVKAVTETVKETAKKVEEAAAKKVEEVAEVAADTKKAVKTTAAKKTTAKKTAVKETVYLQYLGKEIDKDDLMKRVKEVWTKELKNKVGDMKSVTLYLKPEENRAYFVINGDVTGSVEM